MADGVDKGGLNYPLGFDYDPKGLQAFLAGIDQAKKAADELRRAANTPIASAASVSATRQQADATRAATSAARENAAAISLQEKAARKLDAIQYKLALDAEVRAQAERDGVRDIKAKVKALTEQEIAEEKVAAIRAKNRVQALVEAEAARQGVVLGKQRVEQLTVQAEAEARLQKQVRARLVDSAKERLAQEQGIDLSKRKAVVYSAEEKAQQAIIQAIDKRNKLEALAQRGFNARGQFVGVEQARKELEELDAATARTSRTSNSLLFTFRRLFGVFAAFAALRAGVAGTLNVITEAVNLNAQLEQAKLGVAALLTGVASVRDATGQTVDQATALVLAQQESAKQIALLRRDALQTAASFQELAETFQTALGPGLTAGLDPDQVRAFTVQISQAAAALGVQSNQLGEEIRSLLSATITARTTRIASALGITNEDIRNAREAGKLAEFLNSRFAAFSEAGKAGLSTFTVLLSNLRDTFEQVLSQAGLDFFNELKGLATDVQQALVVRDADGLLRPRPEVVDVFRNMLSAVTGLTKAVRTVAGDLDVILSLSRAISTAFSGASAGSSKLFSVITALTRPLLDVAALMADVSSAVFRVFGSGGVLDRDTKALGLRITLFFQQVGVSVLTMLSTIVGAAGPLSGMAGVAKKLDDALIGAVGNMTRTERALAALTAPAQAKQDVFSTLTPLVVGLRRETEDFNKTIERLGDDLADAKVATQLADLKATGASEAAAKAVELRLKAEEQVRRRTIAATREQDGLETRLLEIQQQRLVVEQRIQALGVEANVAVLAAEGRLRDLVKLRREAAEAEAGGQTGEQAAKRAAAAALEAEIQQQFSEDTIRSATERLNLYAQEQIVLEQIGAVTAERSAVEKDVNAVLEERLRALAAEQNFAGDEAARRIEDETRKLEAEGAVLVARNQTARELVALDARHATEQERARAAAEGNLRVRLAEIEALRVKQQIERANLQIAIERANTPQEQAALRAQSTVRDVIDARQVEEAALRVSEARVEVQQLRDEAERPVSLGFATALQNLDTTPFQLTIDFMTSAVQAFAATATQALFDAFFEPQKDIRETFGDLFKALGQQLTQLLIQALVVKSLSAAGFGFSGGGEVPAGGFAKGGRVPRARRSPHLAHFSKNVQAFALGGRPAGLAASDTVPAWLTPGEFVHRLSAVRTYGTRVMSAINNSELPAPLLKALASGTAPVASPVPRAGYASGGEVASGVAASAGPMPAVVVANEQMADMIFRGGRGSLIRFMRENRTQIKAALG